MKYWQRIFLLPAALFGIGFIVFVTFQLPSYGWYRTGKGQMRDEALTGSKLQPTMSDNVRISARYFQRKRELKLGCRRTGHSRLDPNTISLRYRTDRLVFGRLHWCRIAKVGTTYIKYGLNEELEKWQASNAEALKKTIPEKMFVVVREPYGRLLSGYVDKVVTTPQFWHITAVPIVELLRPSASKHEKRCSHDVTFPEFVKFFIHSEKTGKSRNVHFIPQHDHCDLCGRDYDYIAHLETFKEDFDFILKSVNVEIPIVQQEDKIIVRKGVETLDEGKEIVERCLNKWSMMKTLWWSFQSRGFIPNSMDLPISKGEGERMTGQEFGEMALKYYKKTKGTFNSKEQRKQFVIQMYSKIPLTEKLALQAIFEKDFKFFGYDPKPSEVFQ